jgi:acyl-CoA hydrolase
VSRAARALWLEPGSQHPRVIRRKHGSTFIASRSSICKRRSAARRVAPLDRGRYSHPAMLDDYRGRVRSLQEAAALVGPSDDVLVPLAPGQPVGFLRALGTRAAPFERLTLWCALLQEPSALLTRSGVRVASQFFGPVERTLVGMGTPVEFAPADFHGLEILARRMRPRVVASTVSPPDEDGYLTFGVHAGASELPFYEAARDPDRLAVAEVNRFMPATRGLPEFGGHRIHFSEVDVLVENDQPLTALPPADATDADRRMAALIEELVPDGATLQFGIGGVPNEIAKLLAKGPRGDFGIHTEMLVDGVRALHDAGKVTNRKGSYDGFSVCTFALGSTELYAWAAAEPQVRFLPVSAINFPSVIARNRRVVSINSALMIDLHGQVVADSIAGRQYSGIGGHEAFVTGAREAEGGKSILCLYATVNVRGELRSRIVPSLPAGSIVTTPRHQVNYVATENGVVNLFGLTDRERRSALISLADPAFRDELRAAR